MHRSITRFTTMRKIRKTGFRIAAGVVVLWSVLASFSLADVDSARGKALYENHCGTCHDNTVHKRENRLVKSKEELRTWVSSMGAHTGLDWRDEDIDDVTFYLSFRLYRFNE